MTFVGFPGVQERERSLRAAPLRASLLRKSPAQALAAMGRDFDSIELLALGARAAYKLRTPGKTVCVFADDGNEAPPLAEPAAIASAAAWVGGRVRETTPITEVDQWTPQADQRGQLPLLRLRVDDTAATELYVTRSCGEVVQRTTFRTRAWAWLGAIPHWIYPIQLRRHGTAWRTLVVVLSGIGGVACITGLLHGFSVMRVGRRSVRGERLPLSPFKNGSVAWHHLLGLSFGVLAFSWVMSGMLSFYPFASSAESGPRRADLSAFRAAPLAPASFRRDPAGVVAACEASLGREIKRVQLVLAGGDPFYVCHDGAGGSRIVRADAETAPAATLERTALAHAARVLGEGAPVVAEDWLGGADAYYYPTHFDPELSFPVVRTRFANGLVTYVDPRTATVVRRFSRGATVYRWLYHGLHSLDFPALYRRPLLRQVVMVLLLLGGCSLALSGVWLSVCRGFRGKRALLSKNSS